MCAQSLAFYTEVLLLVESQLGPGAFIVADNIDNSPEYMAHVRFTQKRLFVFSFPPTCRAVDTDWLRLIPIYRDKKLLFGPSRIKPELAVTYCPGVMPNALRNRLIRWL
jgi:hypothetical protein